MTVRDCDSTGPCCCDISHHCQFSRFRVRPDIHHQLTWETLVEWRRIGIFMDKGSQIMQLPVVGVRSLVTLLVNDWWLLALMSKDILSRTQCLSIWQGVMWLWNYIWRVLIHHMTWVRDSLYFPFFQTHLSTRTALWEHVFITTVS